MRTSGLFKEKLHVDSDKEETVRLVDFTPEADIKIVASFLHTSSSQSFEECLKKARRLNGEEKSEFFKKAFFYMEFYDSTLREFEFIDLTFDLIISASCFAQLKRHRMATITSQRYDPELGVTVPPSIEEIGAKEDYMEIIEKTNSVFSTLKKEVNEAADYILTNSHRRRVLFKVNVRELYHISRLREDTTAQWDIRQTTRKMIEMAAEVMPLSLLLIGGKDSYPQIYRKIFGKDPKLFPPDL
jgi:thymidylate synthase ThyX